MDAGPRPPAPALICVVGACLGLISALPARAAADPALHDQPASARSLPADNLPPFGMLDDQGHFVPTPPRSALSLPPRGPGAPPESTAPGPSLAHAVRAARAAVDRCAAAGYRVGAAVVDSAGEARAMLTADHADGSHVFVAMRKALTAVAFGMPSSAANEAVTQHEELVARVTPNMFVEAGALPIVQNGAVIGAIGVSGAAGWPIGHQDELCAAAGLAASLHADRRQVRGRPLKPRP
ncbi:MAG: heme-binding protein [Steroidobacteraceae bacterium]